MSELYLSLMNFKSEGYWWCLNSASIAFNVFDESQLGKTEGQITLSNELLAQHRATKHNYIIQNTTQEKHKTTHRNHDDIIHKDNTSQHKHKTTQSQTEGRRGGKLL